ncbi:mpv17 / PMP22 family domain-containing protein [Trichoderma breve]|uniref:Mpv17 / PMP22 family domain-containing protein n=1 Tax=Trichoderma breve TaxID=2034170 RepID=A0A9W9BDS3_9HYPO|nr:mpv17 / PMP22 family domain-containing protein [Trichoderma breve]KAJ4858510.1 mpv17 / PMP22 family domain-containing protein [Trichoderma breve]
MAPSPIIQATLQSSLLAALSNILAQAITAYRNNEAVTIDWVPVFQYVLFAVVSTPPNFLWQDFLESTFPAHPSPKPPSDSKKKSPSSQPPPLSLTNTVLKFLLDQTIGAALNTLLFSTFTHSLRQAMVHAPRITNLPSAAKYWSSAGAVDFNRVDFARVWAASKAEFWALMFAAAKLWPAVSLVNFTLVKSVQGRNLVGALAGVAWGVYISLAMGN